MRAYDSIFATLKIFQNKQYELVKNHAKELISHTKAGEALLPIKLQEELKEVRDAIGRMESVIEDYVDVLNAVIDDDEKMALMNLTLLKERPELIRL